MSKMNSQQKYDHSSNKEFYDYYVDQSVTDLTIERMTGIRDAVLRIRQQESEDQNNLKVADIGCGAGSLSRLWAEAGHEVYGLDVSEPLIQLAQERATSENLKVTFRVGSATHLPWDNASFDVCTVPELLEHVADWQQCLNEFCRILKPGGILYLSTSNLLCPKQHEFTLPLYSWYPAPIKKYCEKLAVTSHPQIVNYAKYPAVHWLTFFQLKTFLREKGLQALDCFDIMNMEDRPFVVKAMRGVIVRVLPVRWLAHVATPYTVVIGVKNA